MSNRIYLIIFTLLSVAASSFGQTPSTSDCIGSSPVCGSTSTPATPNAGIGIAEINPDLNCLRDGEKNSNWFTFTVSKGGDLCLTIYPSVGTDDFDWAIFDLTGASCADIGTDSTILVDCNFKGVPQGCVGNTGPNGISEFPCDEQNSPCLKVETGEHYALYISSFKQGQSDFYFDIDESSPTSAIIIDAEPPAIDSISVPITCGVAEIEVTFSESILCESVDASDFILHAPDGDIAIATIVNAPCELGSPKGKRFVFQLASTLATAGKYELELTGTIEDECNNVQNTGQSLEFNVDAFELTYTTKPATCTSNDGSATINPEGGTPPYIYEWANGSDQATSNGINSNWHYLTVTDSIGCAKSDSLFVGKNDFNPQPFAVTTPATCIGATDGQATIGASGGIEPYTFVWAEPVNATGQNQINLAVGSYQVTISDGNGCDTIFRVTIGAPVSDPIIAVGDTTICVDGSAKISALTVLPSTEYTFRWIGFPTDTLPVLDVTLSEANTIGVFARHETGCYTDSDYVSIQLMDSLNAIISPNNVTVFKEDSATITALVRGGNGQYTYNWIGFSTTTSEVKLAPLESGDYLIRINDGCETPAIVDTVKFNIINLHLPTAFTPQGDGLNDLFCAIGESMDLIDFELRIFDRWGTEIWQTNDHNECWNGQWGASQTQVPPASYVWKVSLRSEVLALDKQLFGFINLIK